MTPDVVVDIGNSRIKWGRCSVNGITDFLSLPHDSPEIWEVQHSLWAGSAAKWAVAGSDPDRRDRFADWLQKKAVAVQLLTDWTQIGVAVKLSAPARVGHDRLFNARAAAVRSPRFPVIVVDTGTAVTVDLIDGTGAFCGGVIFPGVEVMAWALKKRTARLPEVDVHVSGTLPSLPGTDTEAAIRAGIWWTVVGGIRAIADEYRRATDRGARLLLTGGDAEFLLDGMPEGSEYLPFLTLEGIRIAAEALP